MGPEAIEQAFSRARSSVFGASFRAHHTRLVAPGAISEELGSPLYHGGVIDESSAGLHPAKYFFGIARLASRAGATLHAYSAVTAIERVEGGLSGRTVPGGV